MNLWLRVLSVAVLFALVSPIGADEKPKPVKPEKTWAGEVKLEVRKEAPKNNYVADKDAWEKLWKATRGDEKVPAVDFDKELVLVAFNSDPNSISIGASLDDKGNLSMSFASTLAFYANPTTCKYQFALIKREGIKTISGKAIEKSEKKDK